MKRAQRRLSELLREAGLLGERVASDAGVGPDPRVRGVAHSSASCRPGDVFVAVRGVRDGADFAAEAVERGASAVVAASADRRLGVPWIRVEDDRGALARLAVAVAGRPSERLAVSGITGTKGKTTTAEMLAAILEADGRSTGLVGTVECRWPGAARPSARTTPEADELQGMLAEMVEAGCSDAVVEVSSHALALKRVLGTRFRAVGFTNLSRDHLDWHGDFETYFREKRRLFTEVAPEAPAAIGVDDEHGRRLVEELRRADPGRPLLRCGFAQDADLVIARFDGDWEGSRLRLVASLPALGLEEEMDVELRMPGRHDAQDAALAAGLALLRGVAPEAIARGLASLPGVAGRLEAVRAPDTADVAPGEDCDEPRVFVDYAHAPAALEGVLEAVRELTPGRLWCVFGCGGDRDRGKRPEMGRIAGRLADAVVVTSDNPRGEDPGAIVDEILPGLEGCPAEVHVELDRRKAIDLAVSAASAGDVVVVAGKGHETTQEIGGTRHPFDDREVVRELLRRRRGGRS